MTLFQAVKENNLQKILEHIRLSQAVNILDDHDYTPLMYAAESGNFTVVNMLLDAGANDDFVLVESYLDSLALSVSQGHEDIAKLLASQPLADNDTEEHAQQSRREFHLACVFYYGIDVPVDLIEALKWYNIAASHAHSVAEQQSTFIQNAKKSFEQMIDKLENDPMSIVTLSEYSLYVEYFSVLDQQKQLSQEWHSLKASTLRLSNPRSNSRKTKERFSELDVRIKSCKSRRQECRLELNRLINDDLVKCQQSFKNYCRFLNDFELKRYRERLESIETALALMCNDMDKTYQARLLAHEESKRDYDDALAEYNNYISSGSTGSNVIRLANERFGGVVKKDVNIYDTLKEFEESTFAKYFADSLLLVFEKIKTAFDDLIFERKGRSEELFLDDDDNQADLSEDSFGVIADNEIDALPAPMLEAELSVVCGLLILAIESQDVKKVNRVIFQLSPNINILVNGAYAEKMWTPLHLACHLGDPEIVFLLLDLSPHMDVEDFLGNTPLIIAVSAGHAAVVDLLLSFFCDLDVINDVGLSAKVIAQKKGLTDILTLIVDAEEIRQDMTEPVDDLSDTPGPSSPNGALKMKGNNWVADKLLRSASDSEAEFHSLEDFADTSDFPDSFLEHGVSEVKGKERISDEFSHSDTESDAGHDPIERVTVSEEAHSSNINLVGPDSDGGQSEDTSSLSFSDKLRLFQK